MSRSIKQAGDTIIEVLIAVAIVSSVLAITYSIMNRNVITMRDNQEHTEASKIAQGQAEALLNAWNNDTTPITDMANNGFCMLPASLTPQAITGGSPTADPAAEVEYVNYFNSGCQSADAIYNYGIRRNAQGAYVITVRWYKLGSDTRNERVIVYRLE